MTTTRTSNDDRADGLNLETPAGKANAAHHAKQVAENKKK